MTLRTMLAKTADGQKVRILSAYTGRGMIDPVEAQTLVALFEDTFKFPGDWYDAEVGGYMIDGLYVNTIAIYIYAR